MPLSTTSVSVHPSALYSLLVSEAPLATTAGESLPRSFRLAESNTEKGVVQSADNGNFGFKGVMLHARTNFLIGHTVIAATGPVAQTRTKVVQIKYRVRDLDTAPSRFSDWFLIGRTALDFSPASHLSLGVGSTSERLKDIRQLHFLLACHVETLRSAEYPPNKVYKMLFNYGLPNEEFANGELTAASEDALGLISDHRFEIECHHDEVTDKYILEGVDVIAAPQTSGTYTALHYDLKGKLLDDIEEEVIVDLGGGHNQWYKATRILDHAGNLNVVTTGGRLGVGLGTIALARIITEALQERYNNLTISDIHSQIALMDGKIRIGGKSQELKTVVSPEMLDRAVASQLSDTLKVMQQESARITFTGGGFAQELFHAHLMERASSREDGVLFLDQRWTPRLSSYGLYLQMVMEQLRRLQEEGA